MPLDKEELMKLPPEERIKKLKEMEEQREKEIKEAEKLKKEAERQMFVDAVENDGPPVDIAQFTNKILEETIAHENIPDVPEDQNIKYANPFNNVIDLYEKIKVYAENDDPVSSDQAKTVGYLYDVFNEVVDEMASKEQEIEQIASGMKRFVKEIMGEYHANVKYDSEIK